MQPAETMVEAEKSLSHTGSARVSKDAYILGPGDRLQIELLDLPELSGSFRLVPTAAFICHVYVTFTWRASPSRNYAIY